MIKKVYIQEMATFDNPVQLFPEKLNFIYGSNGSGKTTISNLIGGYIKSDNCLVENDNEDATKVLVYNKYFVEENFSQSVKGIFTLGEDSIHAQENLEKFRKENQDKLATIETKKDKIKKLNSEIKNNKIATSEKCWRLQQSIGSSFSSALIGFRNSKQNFFKNCISVFDNWDKNSVENIETIKNKYSIAYSEDSKIYELFPIIDISKIDMIEKSTLLNKVITGSNDTPIGQFIELLNNSDWVKQGLKYANVSENQCPFCQQLLPNDLQREIESFFDEEYKNDCAELDKFIQRYITYFDNISELIVEIIKSEIPLINTENLDSEYTLFVKQLKINTDELMKKKEAPSTKIIIDSLKKLLERIKSIIETYNNAIISNNEIVKNQALEQKKCTNLLWNYIVSELKDELESYNKFVNDRQKAINSISSQITMLQTKLKENKEAMEVIEDSLTSVAPTVTEINKILSKFDFKGFYLKENDLQKGTYLILREDGTDAKDTLSEGEYNFITFLYFYYLVYGSQEKTGISDNKIVVIDDPISSLDSNVLFIVSTLVKNLIKDCRENTNGIQQIFIFTHNVYFHKEITFLGSRQKFRKKEVLFGILRKRNNITSFHKFEENPIESTYQLMWRELKEENLSSVTSFNTMRRILEYYFKIIGDIDYEKCINEFEGTDKIVCKSLVSCINDGSHFISDDFVIAFDEEDIENYQRIFQLIFEKLGHIQHYNMMMDVPVS